MKIVKEIINFLWPPIPEHIYRTLINDKPKIGDKVKVAVGFSSYKNEGIVASIGDDFCWIDQFNSKGEYLRSFTASFSYCHFEYLPKKFPATNHNLKSQSNDNEPKPYNQFQRGRKSLSP